MLDPGMFIYFSWDEVTSATQYYLWVEGPSGLLIKKFYTADEADCDAAGCSIVPARRTWSSGTYTWWVQAWNEAGSGPWSAPLIFEIPAPVPPGKPTLISPAGAIFSRAPAYTWHEVPGATQYDLLVTTASGVTVIKSRYEASALCSVGVCMITPITRLTVGTYTWQVRARNEAGMGPWSDSMGFRVTGFIR
jgi:hypothetical protein